MRLFYFRSLGIILPDHVFTFYAFSLAIGKSRVNNFMSMKGIFDSFGGILPSLPLISKAILEKFPGKEKEKSELDGDKTSKSSTPRFSKSTSLHFRYVRDPPEFVTIATGDSDGGHWGLIYDRSDMLPSHVAFNYAMDDGINFTHGSSTLQEEFRYLIESYLRDFHYGGEEGEEGEAERAVSEIREGLFRFGSTTERQEKGEEYLKKYERTPASRLETLDGLGVNFSVLSSVESGSVGEGGGEDIPLDISNYSIDGLIELFQSEEKGGSSLSSFNFSQSFMIDALVWARDEYFQAEGSDEEKGAILLSLIYSRLGQQSLADITRLHQANRTCRNVDWIRVGTSTSHWVWEKLENTLSELLMKNVTR